MVSSTGIVQSETETRSLAIDMAKGIAICLVVFAHTLRGLLKAGALEPSAFYSNIDYIIYTFHMPIFFVFAGYFFRHDKDDERRFWRSRLITIAYPYFFWSLIHGGLQVGLSGSSATNGTMSASRLVTILWDPIIPFWFLYALFFCYILKRYLGRLSAEIILAGAAIAFALSFEMHPTVFSDIAYGFFYFSLGSITRKYNVLQILPKNLYFTILIFVLFIFTSLISYYAGVPERMPVVSAILGMIATYLLCENLKTYSPSAGISRALMMLGQCSMGIYVMHISMIGFTRLILLKIFHLHSEFILLAAITSCAIIVPFLFQVLAIRFNIDRILAVPASGTLISRNKTNRIRSSSKITT